MLSALNNVSSNSSFHTPFHFSVLAGTGKSRAFPNGNRTKNYILKTKTKENQTNWSYAEVFSPSVQLWKLISGR